MSAAHPSIVSLNLEQQHKLARDLLRAARDDDGAAVARIRAVRPEAGTESRPLNLSDAQFAIAREAGFDSWPTLVAAIAARDLAAFREAVEAGDARRVGQLVALPHVREHVNEPAFAFGQRAAHIA